MDQLRDNQHGPCVGHHLGGVGKVLATQDLAGGLQAGIDQRLALVVGTGRHSGENGGGQCGCRPRKDGSAMELHFLLLGRMTNAGESALAATAG